METKRKKTGGRVKGTPNRTTSELKTLVKNFVSENWEQLQKDFKSKLLHPKDRLFFIEKLMKYVIPIMGSVNGSIDIKRQLGELSDSDVDKILNKLIEAKNSNLEYEQQAREN